MWIIYEWIYFNIVIKIDNNKLIIEYNKNNNFLQIYSNIKIYLFILYLDVF
jgi:hypothetical protein